jgi:putative ABC transport system ATP-binding protein
LSKAHGVPPHPGLLSVSALELRDVVKHYRGDAETVRAVDGVTLTVQPGELVGLWGPSGSGKSTLLLLIAGLLAADQGSIRFDGREVTGFSARESAAYRRHDLGFVSQQFHLIPHASALDNAIIGLGPLGFTAREARAKTLPWLVKLGLGARATYTAEQLSMGEQQRVAIATALVGEPGLLLADEPTGNLDTERGREVLELLRKICDDREIPGVLVTHDSDAIEFVDRALTLRDGRLIDEPPSIQSASSAT